MARITRVTKEASFDCAHMLSNYEGKCNNLHGHTYKLQVTVMGEIKQADGADQDMVIDFVDLNKIIKTVTDFFDHKVVFSAPEYREDAEKALCEWALKYCKDNIVMPNGKCTAENMAAYIESSIQSRLYAAGQQVQVVSVKLWETPTSFAEVF